MSFADRCNRHLPEARSFCALLKGHPGEHAQFPRGQGVVPNDALAMVRGQIHTLEADLRQLRTLEANELKDTRIICTGDTFDSTNGCRRLFPIKELIYIQTYWYTRPHGCTGGDYWNLGEGQFECPECRVKNRLYERDEIVKLKEFFKTVEKRDDHNEPF